MEMALKSEPEDLDIVLKLFPSLQENEKIRILIEKFRNDQ